MVMVRVIKDNIRNLMRKAMEHLPGQMEMYTRENKKKVNSMDLVF